MKLKARIEQVEAKLMPQASVIYKHVRVEPDYEGPIFLHVEEIGAPGRHGRSGKRSRPQLAQPFARQCIRKIAAKTPDNASTHAVNFLQ